MQVFNHFLICLLDYHRKAVDLLTHIRKLRCYSVDHREQILIQSFDNCFLRRLERNTKLARDYTNHSRENFKFLRKSYKKEPLTSQSTKNSLVTRFYAFVKIVQFLN